MPKTNDFHEKSMLFDTKINDFHEKVFSLGISILQNEFWGTFVRRLQSGVFNIFYSDLFSSNPMVMLYNATFFFLKRTFYFFGILF